LRRKLVEDTLAAQAVRLVGTVESARSHTANAASAANALVQRIE
jgi:hypothetical protein